MTTITTSDLQVSCNALERVPSRATWPPPWLSDSTVRPTVAMAVAVETTPEPAFQPVESAAPEPTPAVNPPKLQPVTSWPAAAADFVLLLTPDDLPSDPKSYGPECVRIDRRKYLRSLKSDVLLGPNGPRARYGAVQNELLLLTRVLTSEERERS